LSPWMAAKATWAFSRGVNVLGCFIDFYHTICISFCKNNCLVLWDHYNLCNAVLRVALKQP
ncbi:hypothetical protein KKF17_03385, partial [Patescibacteria group bacterium]|nr:hypothetical protein [Patescibacteria group bacterium]